MNCDKNCKVYMFDIKKNTGNCDQQDTFLQPPYSCLLNGEGSWIRKTTTI